MDTVGLFSLLLGLASLLTAALSTAHYFSPAIRLIFLTSKTGRQRQCAEATPAAALA